MNSAHALPPQLVPGLSTNLTSRYVPGGSEKFTNKSATTQGNDRRMPVKEAYETPVIDTFDRDIAASRLEAIKFQLFIKRSFDVFVSLSLLLLFSPLLLIVAVAIRITSPGPILFVQWRCGHRGSKFPCYKFRSMTAERSDRDEIQTIELNRAGVLAKSANDRRVTGVGRFIRKTSIDELPQLLNVLRGEMSLVGPRPLMPH